MTLLEASPNPGGLSTGWRTASGRAVEAGMKGFWYQVGTGVRYRYPPAALSWCKGATAAGRS